MRKAYLFLYSDSMGGREAVRAWANREPSVIHWRFDMPHLFYIISERSAAELSQSFVNYNGRKGKFLIIEATDNRQGLLLPETWYLLRHKKQKPKEG